MMTSPTAALRVDAPVIEIPEEFFGIWYMDCMDDPKKYDGKTVKYLAQVCQTPQAGKGALCPDALP